MLTLAELKSRYGASGKVVWIGLRPDRKAELIETESARIEFSGLVGDHRSKPGKRAVTLIQAEHLPAISSFLQSGGANFGQLRRNIGVSGINLLALRENYVRVGTAILKITGPCAPCSRMEAEFGCGGYNAVRGHGGVTAEVISPGDVAIGDALSPTDEPGI